MTAINFAIAFLSILTMAICIFSLFKLIRKLSVGLIKNRMNVLLGLLVFFFFGYLFSPFFQYLKQFEYTTLLVYLVFFFGAVFVLITINTIGKILTLSGILKND